MTGREEIRKEGDVFVAAIDGARMVLVPGGPFTMGCDEKDIFAEDDTKPPREVILSPFLIGVFPVTNRQYSIFIEEGGYGRPEWWDDDGWRWKESKGFDRPLSLEAEGFGDPAQPASGVSWFEARAYARWAGRHLPTEAQWEMAARGIDGRRYPWGEDPLPDRHLCNFDGQVGRTTPSGAYPAGKSPWGCEDMAGNVNNWCRDSYAPGFYGLAKREGLNRDPVCEEVGLPSRSDRGGGFATPFTHIEVLRCTHRLAWPLGHRELWNGFRTVTDPPGPDPGAGGEGRRQR